MCVFVCDTPNPSGRSTAVELGTSVPLGTRTYEY